MTPFPLGMEEQRGSVFTRVVLAAATLEETQELAALYAKEYPPSGYSTRLVGNPRQRSEGGWEVQISRYSSCD